MDPPIDQIQLNFNATGLAVLNVVLGFVMFGVALDMRPADFRRALASPKPALIGLLAQFFLLPALTYVLVSAIHPLPSMALGMILIASCPPTDVLVNNAGITHLKSFGSGEAAAVRRVLEVNFLGAVHATAAAFDALVERRGLVIVISSVAGYAPVVGRTAYCASKHAAGRVGRAAYWLHRLSPRLYEWAMLRKIRPE